MEENRRQPFQFLTVLSICYRILSLSCTLISKRKTRTTCHTGVCRSICVRKTKEKRANRCHRGCFRLFRTNLFHAFVFVAIVSSFILSFATSCNKSYNQTIPGCLFIFMLFTYATLFLCLCHNCSEPSLSLLLHT